MASLRIRRLLLGADGPPLPAGEAQAVKVVFRCDASLAIGSGHVIRSRTLARELSHRGGQVWFVCRRQPGDLVDLLREEFTVLDLPPHQGQPGAAAELHGLAGRALYRAWLGCPPLEDARDSAGALARAAIGPCDWLVSDHYGLDTSWKIELQRLLASTWAPAGTRWLVIDDLADRPLAADLLLDQNYFGAETQQRYRDLLPPRCLPLLGPRHALLGPEFATLHDLLPRRTELGRVLLFCGGVDESDLTGLALQVLAAPSCRHLAVDVVLGSQCPHRGRIAAQVSLRPGTTLHLQVPTLAGLMARADLAIGAGGATTWERACLGLPSVVAVDGENQRPIRDALAAEGYVLAWDGRKESLALILAELQASPQRLSSLSGACYGLTSGAGAQLCASAMEEAR